MWLMPGYAIGQDGARPTIKLVTPPLFANRVEIFRCVAVNLHHRSLQVDITVYDAAGEPVCGVGPQRLAPGQTALQECNSDLFTDPIPIRYCEFTYKGQRGRVLGTAQANEASVPATFVESIQPAAQISRSE
jgi:hypothetical protein